MHQFSCNLVLALLLSLPALAFGGPGMPAAVPDSGGMGFRPGPVSNFLVEIVWPRESHEAVYTGRPYEVRVIPRDRFMNPTDTTLRIRLTARFSGEFDAATLGFFQFDLDIHGPTSFVMTSNTERSVRGQPQWIMAYCVDSLQISGKSADFSVLSHAPFPVQLKQPAQDAKLSINIDPRETDRTMFSWEPGVPPDPYYDMRSAEHDSVLVTDQLRYEIVIWDWNRRRSVRIPADEDGTLPTKLLSHRHIRDIMREFDPPYGLENELFWQVNSTDGVYPGGSLPEVHRLIIQLNIPDAVELEGRLADAPTLNQNYPNPFNPSTTIDFTLPSRTAVRLSVIDNLGREIAVLADGVFEAGSHTMNFDGGKFPSGVYSYRLQADGSVLTRQMLLLK